MDSKKKRDGVEELFQELHETFLTLPWWGGPPAALIVFLAAKMVGWTFASGEEPLFQMIGAFIAVIAPVFAFLVLFIWGIALLNRRYRRRLLSSRDGIQSIRALSWQDFERLVGEALRGDGYAVEERGGGGADGGVDLVARRAGETLLVQCKQRKSWNVGVRVVREMYGVMMAEQATSTMIVTTGGFTKDALAFAEKKPIRLLDGEQLASFISRVQQVGSNDSRIGEPPSITSTAAPLPAASTCLCPKCGSPMVIRTARKGANAGQHFLGCSNYPKCKGTRDLGV